MLRKKSLIEAFKISKTQATIALAFTHAIPPDPMDLLLILSIAPPEIRGHRTEFFCTVSCSAKNNSWHKLGLP
jgi:hypothetical protein